MRPSSSSKTRSATVFSTMYRASPSVSSRAMPSSTTRPGPVSPTVSPPTLTHARVTRCSTALIRIASGLCHQAGCRRALLLRRPARPDLDTARKTPLVVSQQINDDARDVFGLELPALLFAHRVAAELRVDRAGHDVADLDSVVPDLLHERLAEAVETELRGVVGGHAWVRIRARERRDVDDVAAAAPLHNGDGRAAAVEDAEQVRLQNRAELFRRHLLDRLEEADARIIDQHVHAAELLDRVRNERLALFINAHVACSARHASNACVFFTVES